MPPVNYAAALDAHRNMNMAAAPKGPGKLSHIEVSHHMTDGSSQLARIEPGGMLQHIADCPHCGGSANPAAE